MTLINSLNSNRHTSGTKPICMQNTLYNFSVFSNMSSVVFADCGDNRSFACFPFLGTFLLATLFFDMAGDLGVEPCQETKYHDHSNFAYSSISLYH